MNISDPGPRRVPSGTRLRFEIHTLDRLKRVYLNIFSCKNFDAQKATNISKAWFKGDVISCTTIIRQ